MKKSILALLLLTQMIHVGPSIHAQETTIAPVNGQDTNSDWSIYEVDLASTDSQLQFQQLFTNDNPITIESESVTFTINRYAYYQLQNETYTGNSLFLDVSFKNKTDLEFFLNDYYAGKITGIDREIITLAPQFNNPELNLLKIIENNENLLPPNGEIHGAFILSIYPEEISSLEKEGFFFLKNPGVYPERDSVSNAQFKYNQYIPLPITREKLKLAGAESDFYGDRATAEAMGVKILKESKEINETKTNNDISVTLNGYQIVDFELNADNKGNFLFKQYQDQMVLLTLDVTVQNNSAQIFNLDSMQAILRGENDAFIITNALFELENSQTPLENGEVRQRYFVFSMTKEEYNKMSAGSYFVEFNLINDEFSQINDYNSLNFTIK